MKNKNSQKGITIIALVITVIMLLILASVATYTGIESYDKAEQIKFVSQMKLIQTKVDEKVQEDGFTLEGYGTVLTDEQKQTINNAVANGEILSPTEDDYSNYVRYFSKEQLSTQLSLDNIDEGIIINFKTREVISTVGFEYGGTIYYTQYKLPKGEKLTQYVKPNTTLSVEYSKILQDLSWVIKIEEVKRIEKDNTDGTELKTELKLDTLKYELGKKNSNGAEYTYLKQTNPNEILISEAGDYSIKVIDNAGNETEEKFTIKIANPPIIKDNWVKLKETKTMDEKYETIYAFEEKSEKDIWYDYSNDAQFAYAKNENKDIFVWIPRYAKNNSTNKIKFIKGNSNIFEDNTKMDNNWTVPEEFSPNGIKLTGFWLKVTAPNPEGKGIDTFLTNINKNDIIYVYEQ